MSAALFTRSRAGDTLQALSRARARVGRGKCACAKTARRIIVRLGWKSNSTTLYTMVVVAVCIQVDPRKILIGAFATHWYVLTRTAS